MLKKLYLPLAAIPKDTEAINILKHELWTIHSILPSEKTFFKID